MADALTAGEMFELLISDEWNPRFEPERPVMVVYMRTIPPRDHRFDIVNGGINDRLTGTRLATLSVFPSSGPDTVGHLSGVKVGVEGTPVGRANLRKTGETLPAQLLR
jgi:hypothetical protein